MRTLGLLLSVLLVGVCSRSHHGEDHLRLSEEEEQDFVQRLEELEDINEDDDEEELLKKIDEVISMITLVRNARSIVEEEEPDNMVAEDEMVKVLDTIDLSKSENVEAVSEVLKTLPGE